MSLPVAIIGFGFMGRTHAEAYASDPRARLVAIADARPDRFTREVEGDRPGGPLSDRVDLEAARRYSSAAALLDDDGARAVSICVPTHLHADLTVAALERGKHVLVEKPLAVESAHTRRVLDAAAARPDLVCMPAMCMRFWPGWRDLKSAIDEGTYGRVRSATFVRVGGTPHWAREFYLDPRQSGGASLDLHVHDADFVRFCFGDPRAVRAAGCRDADGAVNQIVAAYTFDGGPEMVVADGRWMPGRDYPFSMQYAVTFERAVLAFDSRRDPPLIAYRQDGPPAPVPVAPGQGYEPMVRHFLDCIERGTPSDVVSLRDGANAVRLVEAERRSAETGGAVAFEPVS